MNKLIWVLSLAGIAPMGVACTPEPGGYASHVGQTREATTEKAKPVKAPMNPLETDGTWLVPEEIAPGTYRTSLNDGIFAVGYAKVCADDACQIGTPGFIDNDVFNGPGILVVPPNAVSVEINNITLVPMAGR